MKSNIYKKMIMVFKWATLCAFFLTITTPALFASSKLVQIKSIDEVFITLDIQEGSLEEILRAIESKTEYSFFYTNKNLKDKNQVVLSRKTGSVSEFLVDIALQKRLHFKQINNVISVKTLESRASATPIEIQISEREVEITGNVTNQDGESLPGVAIAVLGTNTGAITDMDGNYSILVPEGATLVFSYIGYATQNIPIGNQSVINVVMEEDTQGLEEIVVTALGIERSARSLGYSTSSVKSEELTVNRTPNMMNALVGKVAGVNISPMGTGPAGSSKIRIRGQSSISGQNNPLIVVNGIPIDNTNFGTNPGNQGADGAIGNRGGGMTSDGGDGLSSINPDDIEDMTILKGAAASALYGSRAKDGVIMITTKSGAKTKGIGVTYNVNYTNEQPLDFTDYQYEYGQGEGGVRPTSANPTSGQWSFGERFQPGMTQVLFDGVTVPYEPNRGLLNQFFRNGQNLTNTISITAGGDNGGITFSFADMNSKGIVPNNTFNRKTVYLGFNYNLTPKLTIRGNVNYSIEENTNPPNVAEQDNSIPTALYNMANSMPLNVLRDNYLDANGNEAVYSRFRNRTNPYFTLNEQFQNIKRDRIFGNVSAKYDILPWLYIQGRIGQDFWSRDQDFNNFPHGHASRAPAPEGFVNGVYTQESRRFREVNADFIASAKQTFGLIDASLSVGGNHMYRSSDRNSVQVTDFIIRDLYTVQNGRVKDPIYNFSERSVNSLFAFAEVSYNKTIYLNGTLRNDWFSTLSEENRSIMYPSVALSYVFTENITPNRFLNFGKFRLAYAEVGSDSDVAPYSDALFYGVGANLFNGQPVGFPLGTRLPNPNLRPMRISEVEAGLELAFLEGRVNLDIAAYNKVTTDQIVSAQISDASGFQTTAINSGQSRNRGVEGLLRIIPIETDNFLWEASINGAYNKTKVLSLLTEEPGERITVGNHVFNGELRQIVGEEMGQVAGFGYRRDEAGNIVYGGNGLPLRTADLINFGSALPRWVGGINNSFNYNGISFSFLVDFRLGGTMLSGTNFNAVRHGLHKMTLEGREGGVVGQGVTETGEVNTVAAPVQTYWEVVRSQGLVEPVIYDSGFWRLRQITLGYDLARIIPQNRYFSSMNLSFVANNVFLLKKWVDNIDPESFGYTSDNLVGMEATGLPSTRGLGFNLNVKF